MYFPKPIVVRIWDVYLVEGRKTIFRVALAIMKCNEKALLKCDIMSVQEVFRRFQESVDVDQLFKVAFGKYTFSKELIYDLIQ